MRVNKLNKIPKNTPYCYEDNKLCPYHKYRMTNYGYSGRKIYQEYCQLLHKYLSIQDQVKDCGLNEIKELEKNNE